ncbi:MAG: sigma factor-like helix-turn-helix DNA-binding protein [Patescibacteria group bacterium]
MTSKHQEEMKQFQPAETISQLLKYLNSKEEDVLRRRYGLTGREQETLEKIGELYNVTRERIRQIENIAIRKLREQDRFSDVVRPVEHTISTILLQHGGVMSEGMLLENLLNFSSDSDLNRQSVEFILEKLLSDRIVRVISNEKFLAGWRLHMTSLGFVESVVRELIAMMDEHHQPMKQPDLLEKFFTRPFHQQLDEPLDDRMVLSFVGLSRHIDMNPFEEYGLVRWGSIRPKRMNDKIYLILKKASQPLHFEEITEQINKVGFDHRKAYAPTVHNELILNEQYVLVGRGIYALQEWGYKPGVVSDVLEVILRNSTEPMTRDELVTVVLKQRVVKKNTIHLALTDRKRFQRLSDGRYTLAQQPFATKEDVPTTPENDVEL